MFVGLDAHGRLMMSPLDNSGDERFRCIANFALNKALISIVFEEVPCDIHAVRASAWRQPGHSKHCMSNTSERCLVFPLVIVDVRSNLVGLPLFVVSRSEPAKQPKRDSLSEGSQQLL